MGGKAHVLVVSVAEDPTPLIEELKQRELDVSTSKIADAEDEMARLEPDLVILNGIRGAMELSTLLDDEQRPVRPRLVIVAPGRELSKLRGLNREIVVSLLTSELGERVLGERLTTQAKKWARHRQENSLSQAPPEVSPPEAAPSEVNQRPLATTKLGLPSLRSTATKTPEPPQKLELGKLALSKVATSSPKPVPVTSPQPLTNPSKSALSPKPAPVAISTPDALSPKPAPTSEIEELGDSMLEELPTVPERPRPGPPPAPVRAPQAQPSIGPNFAALADAALDALSQLDIPSQTLPEVQDINEAVTLVPPPVTEKKADEPGELEELHPVSELPESLDDKALEEGEDDSTLELQQPPKNDDAQAEPPESTELESVKSTELGDFEDDDKTIVSNASVEILSSPEHALLDANDRETWSSDTHGEERLTPIVPVAALLDDAPLNAPPPPAPVEDLSEVDELERRLSSPPPRPKRSLLWALPALGALGVGAAALLGVPPFARGGEAPAKHTQASPTEPSPAKAVAEEPAAAAPAQPTTPDEAAAPEPHPSEAPSGAEQTAGNPFSVEDRGFATCESLVNGPPPEVRDPVSEASQHWKAAAEAIVRGKIESAHKSMCQAVALHPESAAIEGLVLLYVTQSSPKEALRWLERAEAVRPGVRETKNLRGDIYSQLGENDKALAAWLDSFSLQESETARRRMAAKADLNQGKLHLKQGDLPRADRLLRRSVTLDPENTLAFTALAEAQFKRERYGAAIAFADRAIELFDANPEAYVIRGDAALALGRRELAQKSYERALGIRPDFWVATLRLRKLTEGTD